MIPLSTKSISLDSPFKTMFVIFKHLSIKDRLSSNKITVLYKSSACPLSSSETVKLQLTDSRDGSSYLDTLCSHAGTPPGLIEDTPDLQ
jgi:hypothetical protein